MNNKKKAEPTFDSQGTLRLVRNAMKGEAASLLVGVLGKFEQEIRVWEAGQDPLDENTLILIEKIKDAVASEFLEYMAHISEALERIDRTIKITSSYYAKKGGAVGDAGATINKNLKGDTNGTQ